MNRLLFLCTGNYYRSRFAEILFNSLASGSRLDWRADSRGLAVDFSPGNVGPMSHAAFEYLTKKGIRCASMQRSPQRVSKVDFDHAHLIIALDEQEHRPMMRSRFPDWEHQIEYWLVHDLDKWDANTALTAIENQVSHLVRKISQNPP